MENKNLIKLIKNHYKKKYDEIYSPKATKAALYYSKKYGFDSGNKSTYNNEADAFKHTFASALVSMEEGYIISLLGGYYHEWSNNGNNSKEYKMDTHNNGVGRAIARDIKNDYGDKWYMFLPNKKEEIIAERVWQRMKEGKIILDPSGRKKKKKDNKNNSLFKLSINENVNLSEQDKKIERYKKEKELFAPENRVFFDGEMNPAKVPYGSEEDKYVPAMLKQFYENGNKLPKEIELKESVNSGGLIYVDDYVRQDGTHVSGYYRHK